MEQQKPSRMRELFEKHREIVMYTIFGVSTTFVSWITYSLCIKALTAASTELDMAAYVSGIVSWIVAVIVAFITNKIWVFESKSWEPSLVAREALTFFGGRVITGIFEVMAVPPLVDLGLDATLFGVETLPAKIVVTVSVVIMNYILSKFISFRSAKKIEGEEEQ